MIDMYENDQNKRIRELLEAGGKIKLNPELEHVILSLLPPPTDPIAYSSIEQLGPGQHAPCPINTLTRDLSDNVLIKSKDGNMVRIEMASVEEAESACCRINDELINYGYSAASSGKVVEYTQPWHSTAQIVKAMGGYPIACKESNGQEIQIFAAAADVKTWKLNEELENN
jgi:hypothetical protein